MENPQTMNVYRLVMEFMENDFNQHELCIQVRLNNFVPVSFPVVFEPVQCKVIRFIPVRRGETNILTNRGMKYTFKDGSTYTIWYDHNWKDYLEIERILQDETSNT